jgi:hypothetical protein
MYSHCTFLPLFLPENPSFLLGLPLIWQKRHEPTIWARYLAMALSRQLHIRGEVSMLPVEWRDAKGKADWDGALARIYAT